MNAPFIWIALPLIISVILWIIRKNDGLTTWIAVACCGILALLGSVLPIERLISIGFLSINVSSTWIILGRKFILLEADRTFFTMLYAMGALWMICSKVIKPRKSFPAVGLAVLGLMLAAIAVEPFFYSALIIELIVLITIPVLIPPGMKIGQGILRFLIFQTLAVPFILITGWITGIVGVNPTEQATLFQIILFVSLGFAFWLGIFPFYSWIPMVSRESDPFIAGFILSLLPTVILFQAVNLINSFNWLRESQIIFTILKISGVLMVATGGIWSAFQRDLRRLFAFGIIFETGFSLLAISLQNRVGMEYFILAMLPRMVALLLWSYTMARMDLTETGFTLEELNGLIQRKPEFAVAINISMFSIAGIPLLASFPIRLILVQILWLTNPNLFPWLFMGIIGFIFGTFRFVIHMFSNYENQERIPETRISILLMSGGIVLCFLLGLLPKFFLSGLLEILTKFQYLR